MPRTVLEYPMFTVYIMYKTVHIGRSKAQTLSVTKTTTYIIKEAQT